MNKRIIGLINTSGNSIFVMITREPLKNVGGEALARRIWQKKRSLHAVNEHFFAKFNAARASKVIFQRFPRCFRAENGTDTGGRATQDAKTVKGNLYGIHSRLSAKNPQRRREKWISRSALMLVLSCAHVQGEEAALKDPTAPFNSVHSAPANNARVVTKNTSPRWVLDGVLISEDGKKALVNGRWYNERDQINGWQLAQVETAAVVLKQAGKTQRILLYPSLTKNTLTLKPE